MFKAILDKLTSGADIKDVLKQETGQTVVQLLKAGLPYAEKYMGIEEEKKAMADEHNRWQPMDDTVAYEFYASIMSTLKEYEHFYDIATQFGVLRYKDSKIYPCILMVAVEKIIEAEPLSVEILEVEDPFANFDLSDIVAAQEEQEEIKETITAAQELMKKFCRSIPSELASTLPKQILGAATTDAFTQHMPMHQALKAKCLINHRSGLYGKTGEPSARSYFVYILMPRKSKSS